MDIQNRTYLRNIQDKLIALYRADLEFTELVCDGGSTYLDAYDDFLEAQTQYLFAANRLVDAIATSLRVK